LADATLATMTDPYIIHSNGSRSYGTTMRASEWTLSLAPCDLSFVRVNHQTRLQFEGTEVVIGGGFVLNENGLEHHLDPGERGALGPVLRVYPDTLTEASIEDDGTLRLAFERGAVIVVPPDRHYEPWQISGPGSALIVCNPGTEGKLSIWT
jgi:hypothetical protein